MSESVDVISFTVRTAAEFLAVVPHVDEVSLLLDMTRRAGETKKMRRRRSAALLSALFERYGENGFLTRDVNMLVSPEDYGGGFEGASVVKLNADGSVGEVLGHAVSAERGSYDHAGKLSRDYSVDCHVRFCQRCPECGHVAEEYYTLACSRDDCGYKERGCLRCLSPGALACLDSRQRADPIGGGNRD